ncbi:MAG: hypothetical protein KBD21_01675 [Candidatus Pacebacteria bacterium]|nr:hypothetical protein [Candidatus Paceibacterota bacterium]
MEMHDATDIRPNEQGRARTPISWDAHEYVHVEKSPDWYWALGLLAIAGATGALLMENVLFAVFIIIVSFVLALVASRQPNVLRFSITQRGVRIDDTLYQYSALDSFAIDEPTPNHTPKLILKQKGFFESVIIIPILDVDADDVHDFLIAFLEEDEHIEPLTHRLMEWLGF